MLTFSATIYFAGSHHLQAFNILMGILVLAKSCSEHHHHEVSAKKSIPGKCDVLCSSFYYLAHVPFRTFAFALLFAHFRYYASAVIAVQVIPGLVHAVDTRLHKVGCPRA